MKTIPLFALALLTVLAALGAETRTSIPEIKLKDGRVLKNVQIGSVSSGSVTARWDGGRGAIPISKLPDELAAAAGPGQLSMDPAVRSAQRAMMESSFPRSLATHEKIRKILEVVPKLDMSPLLVGKRELGEGIELSGQCFIAAKDGTNYKLGGIEVCIYSDEEFTVYSRIVKERGTVRHIGVMKASNELSNLKQPEVSLALLGSSLSESRTMWQVLPKPQASTRTDADGRFSFWHQVKPPYVVFATGQRLVGSETEYYVWRVNSNDITNPRQILLSNAELLKW